MSELNYQIWNSEIGFQNLVSGISKSEPAANQANQQAIIVNSLVSGALASFLLAIKTQFPQRPLVFISSQDSPSYLHKLQNQILRINENSKIQNLVYSQVSLLEGISESNHHFANISNVLSNWLNNNQSSNQQITLASPKAITQLVAEKNKFAQSQITLAKGQEINLPNLSKSLVELGYTREETVSEIGSFAVRGEIIDIFPADSVDSLPWRINLFGDEIESIRAFEQWSQRSLKSQEINSITISPLFPFILPKPEQQEKLFNQLEAFSQEMTAQTGLDSGNAKHKLDNNFFWQEDLKQFKKQNFSGTAWQRFIPWIVKEYDLPLSYIPENAIIILEEPEALEAKLEQNYQRTEQELQHKLERNLLPSSQLSRLRELTQIGNNIFELLKNKTVLQLSNSDAQSAKASHYNLDTSLVPQFRANLEELTKFIANYFQINTKDKKIIFSMESEASKTLSELFNSEEERHFNLSHAIVNSLKFIESLGLDKGFGIGDSLVFTEFDIFGKKAVIDTKKRKDFRVEDFIPLDLNSIRIGDFLVHLKHGIGRFLKMKVIELDGQKREYITLEYHNGDLLNVPVDQMNLLSLYKGASDGQTTKLSRLGGIDWEKTKSSVRASVQKVAFDLLELYAKRTLEKGFAFAPDTPWQTELEDSFPYKETPDQIRAINEIKEEMESEYTMDRLLCGDVGFGKTEVIIRAAFKAIMSGKQVAVMAPTTVLAQQHFKSFSERLEKFPARLELLTRSKTGNTKKLILEKIKNGDVDLVIGTHALLSKQVIFKDLGLIIVDEEQKFGVNHKEKLKTLKANISILTVSATPIPRTMHMALSGIREMSLISTPPPGRVPIKIQTCTENPKLVRAAIINELERGGQVFYLHNRVESIERKAIELMQLVPEASYKIAHGKMSETEITDVMENFTNHESDVLIATSIIENGIDIPNANTMIIENAERFGLSQLYQLRGRVGRSNDPSKPGHALLMHNPTESLNEQAKARLETISRYSNLGSGYQIALRDMEIRGVGNLLGAEQHGKMVTVGFELYCEMLNEAIAEIKQKLRLGETPDQEIVKRSSKAIINLEEKPVFDFKLNAYIPIDWIQEDSQRIREYQRLSEANSIMQLTGLADEWNDRFGKLPEPVIELMKIVKLRLLATQAGIYGLIKPKGSFLDLNTKLVFEEWKRLQDVLPNWIKDKLAFRLGTHNPTTGLLEASKIMIRSQELDTKAQLDLLEELFDSIIKVIY